MFLCCLDTAVCLSSSYYDVYMCGRFRRQSIYYPTYTINQIMIVIMLQNWNYRHSNHYSAIKCVGFESINYIINLDTVSLFTVFSEND